MTTNLRACGKGIIVDPLYEPERIGSIIIPNAYRNREANLGDVVSAGKDTFFQNRDRVLIRPFRGEHFRNNGHDLLVLERKDVVAKVVDREIIPKPDEVMVLPDWETKYGQKSKIIHTVEEESHLPVRFGHIARIGSEVTTLNVGQYVIIPNNGVEVGLVDTIYYLIPEKEILAIVEK